MPKPAITSTLILNAVVGVAVAPYQIVGTNTPTSYDAQGLPAGLAIDTATGIISGTPTVGGNFQIVLIATNGSGSGYAVLSTYILSANGIYNPDGIVIGGQIVTIAGHSYIFDDFNPKESTKKITSPDEYGRLGVGHGRKALIDQEITGSATLQLENSATPIPQTKQTFQAVHRGAAKWWVIEEVDQPQKAGEEVKVGVTISEVLNP